jgi:hypothetical protein
MKMKRQQQLQLYGDSCTLYSFKAVRFVSGVGRCRRTHAVERLHQADACAVESMERASTCCSTQLR